MKTPPKRKYAKSSKRLGHRHHKPWTPEENDKLTWDWGTFSITTLAKRFGRTELAVYQQAKVLNLGLGVPNGMVTMEEAINRTGFARVRLTRILNQMGVPIKTGWSYPSPKKSNQRLKIVDLAEVEDAVAKWMGRTNLSAMAAHLDVLPCRLTKLLRKAGHEKAEGEHQWWISEELARPLVEAWRATQTQKTA